MSGRLQGNEYSSETALLKNKQSIRSFGFVNRSSQLASSFLASLFPRATSQKKNTGEQTAAAMDFKEECLDANLVGKLAEWLKPDGPEDGLESRPGQRLRCRKTNGKESRSEIDALFESAETFSVGPCQQWKAAAMGKLASLCLHGHGSSAMGRTRLDRSWSWSS